ncbi:MAG: DUF2782 domain-containing protein [Burkholderiales bacterium]
MLRHVIATGALLFCGVALAQPVPPPPPLPPNEPPTYTKPPDAVPSPPATPDATPADPDLEPQVTIIRKETEVVEEVRVAGELRYLRVTPRWGRPYYLVPNGPGRAFQRMDSLPAGVVSVPMWQLFSW